ncbi:MAG: DUF58 domain-containing protein [Planctomycetota bacterium]
MSAVPSAADAARRFLDPVVLARLGRLDLASRLAAESFLSGRHRSVRRGFSAEFSDYREYSPGDDVSDIDWRVYARTDKFYMKCFEAETSMRCVLAVDTSASMAFRSASAPVAKGEYAALAAAALGYLLHRQRDRVGLALFDERLRRLVPPKSRRAHFYSILELLAAGVDEPIPGEASRGLNELAVNLTRRGMVVILSDLLTAEGERLIRAVEHLAYRGQDVLVLQVLDPAELSVAVPSGATLREPESGRRFRIDGMGLSRCRQALKSLLDSYRRRFHSVGVDYALLATGDPFDRALGAFLASRRWHRRGGRPAAAKRRRA